MPAVGLPAFLIATQKFQTADRVVVYVSVIMWRCKAAVLFMSWSVAMCLRSQLNAFAVNTHTHALMMCACRFSIIFFFSALSQMLVDQAYWQSAIAAKATCAVKVCPVEQV